MHKLQWYDIMLLEVLEDDIMEYPSHEYTPIIPNDTPKLICDMISVIPMIANQLQK